MTALEIITGDPNVKVILFNIFGGITRCDDVARGLVEALEKVTSQRSDRRRLTGTNEEEARKILAEHDLDHARTDGRGRREGRRARRGGTREHLRR